MIIEVFGRIIIDSLQPLDFAECEIFVDKDYNPLEIPIWGTRIWNKNVLYHLPYTARELKDEINKQIAIESARIEHQKQAVIKQMENI